MVAMALAVDFFDLAIRLNDASSAIRAGVWNEIMMATKYAGKHHRSSYPQATRIEK